MTAAVVKVATVAFLLICVHPVSALEGGLRRRALQEDDVSAAPAPASFGPKASKDDEEKEKRTEWTYAEAEEWGDGFYASCGGAAQSPINIRSADVTIGYKPLNRRKHDKKDKKEKKAKETGGLYKLMTYKPLDGRKVVNDGHNLQVNGEFGDIELPDGNYTVQQFSFHFPSEHAINGKHADGEMQIVHRRNHSSGSKDLVVVSVLLQELGNVKAKDKLVGVEAEMQNQWRAKVGGFMSQLGFGGDGLPEKDEAKPATGQIDLNTFSMQLSADYYHYFGSMTAPPCVESVHWYVMKTPAIVSKETISSFKKLFPNPANNRPVTPRNGREIIYSEVALPGEYEMDSDEFAKSISKVSSKVL